MTPEQIAASSSRGSQSARKNSRPSWQESRGTGSRLREKRELEGRAAHGRDSVHVGAERQPGSAWSLRHADPQTYQRLKATAQERGVPYVVADEGGDETASARAPDSKVKFVETVKMLYANEAMQRSLGVGALVQQAAAEGKTLRIFRSLGSGPDGPGETRVHRRRGRSQLLRVRGMTLMPGFDFSMSGEVRLAVAPAASGALRPLTRAAIEVALQAQVSEDGVVAPQRDWPPVLAAAIFADLVEEALTGTRGVLAVHVIESFVGASPGGS